MWYLSDIEMGVRENFEMDVCATTMRDLCDCPESWDSSMQSVRNLTDINTILEFIAMNDAGTVRADFLSRSRSLHQYFKVILLEGL